MTLSLKLELRTAIRISAAPPPDRGLADEPPKGSRTVVRPTAHADEVINNAKTATAKAKRRGAAE